jgi:hypothetical protein
MVKLVASAIVTIFIGLGAMSVFAQSDDETYRVYDAVIAEMFRDGKFLGTGNTVKLLIISDTTTTALAADPYKENWDRVKMRLPKLSTALIQAFELKRKSATKLETRFNPGMRYFLVGNPDFEDYSQRRQDWWTAFYKTYPESHGFITFSNVAFGKDGDEALVYFVNWCGEVCGTGHYLLLSKREKNWTVVNRAEMWIS